MRPNPISWTSVAALGGAVFLSGCASTDQHYCPDGMTLRVDLHGAFCSGFGAGFNFNNRASVLRQPWWVVQ